MTLQMNLLVAGVAILCFVALVFVPWDEETIAPEIVNTPVEKIVSDIDEPTINNFEQCIAAGNPAMESYPRQCRTVDGQHFVEEISIQSSGVFLESMKYTKNAPIIDEKKGYFVDEIADGIYWLVGNGYQVMFLTTGEGVIVIDAPTTNWRKISSSNSRSN